MKSPDYNTYRGSLGMSLGVGPFSVLPLSLAPAAYVTDKPRLACVKSYWMRLTETGRSF